MGIPNRREFIEKSATIAAFSLVADWASASTANDKWGDILPQRQLTRDGEKVTAICLGGYHLGFTENPKDAERMIERSMELGVRFFDNARKYHDGRSEEYQGRFLTPKYRDQIFLMTKAPAKTGKEVRQQLDDSLRALKTDHVDLWQIHALQTPKDVDQRLKEGVLDVFLEAREAGKARYLGFTGHRNPITHLHFLSRLEELGIELDTCQMPLNVCDPSFESFQRKVLPVLLKKKYGVIAMKTMAGGSLMGGRIDTTPEDIKTKDIPDVVSKTELSHANLHQYVYSLPVSTLCTGCRFTSELEKNVAVLRELKNLSESDMKRLEQYAEPYAGLIVENYKRIL
jgi:aryl-alcohol dehydrogenase-like predicted oxidoreductase